jgi:trimeric autotransporter adhesin
MKRLTLFFVLCIWSTANFSQSITNTLGVSGLFRIKDASNNYMTVSQSTGYLSLDKSLVIPHTTDSTLGVIFKGSDRFIHNYGTNNIFMGINSGNFTMTGSYNIAIGDQSLFLNVDGSWNTVIGQFSLVSNTSGYQNSAVGLYSLVSNTSGYQNTAMGVNSLYYNTTGYDNIALGGESLSLNTEGYENTAVGFKSLFSNTGSTAGNSSIWNTAVGFHSLYSNTSGAGNTALGHSAGSTIINGSNLTCIGWDSQPSYPTSIDEITLGNQYIIYLRCAATNISSLSDARDKRNIKDLNLGIDFLMKIKPRLFNWDKREWYENNKSDGSKMKGEPTAGFIAQELDEAQTTGKAEWLNLVLKNNPEKLEATPGNLLPIIVKAIQDLKKENDELQIANNELKTSNIELASRLNKFEKIQNMLVTEIEKLSKNDDEITKVTLGEK